MSVVGLSGMLLLASTSFGPVGPGTALSDLLWCNLVRFCSGSSDLVLFGLVSTSLAESGLAWSTSSGLGGPCMVPLGCICSDVVWYRLVSCRFV